MSIRSSVSLPVKVMYCAKTTTIVEVNLIPSWECLFVQQGAVSGTLLLVKPPRPKFWVKMPFPWRNASRLYFRSQRPSRSSYEKIWITAPNLLRAFLWNQVQRFWGVWSPLGLTDFFKWKKMTLDFGRSAIVLQDGPYIARRLIESSG